MRYLLGYPGGNQPGAPSSGPGGAVGGAQDAFGGFGHDRNRTYQGMGQWSQPGQSDNSPMGGLNGPNLGNTWLGGGPTFNSLPNPVATPGLGNPMELGDAGGFGPPKLGGAPQMPQGGFGQSGDGFGNPMSGPGNRIQSFFGNTGVGATPLQRQSVGGIQQFLSQPSPESRTLNNLTPGLHSLFGGQGAGGQNFAQSVAALQPQLNGQNPLSGDLQGILRGIAGGGNPLPGNAQGTLNNQLNADLLSGGLRDALLGLSNQGGLQSQLRDLLTSGGGGADVSAIQAELGRAPNAEFMNALQPRFEQNLAQANQAGGRFGTANAYGRAQATNDFNLLAQQAMQQDLQRRAGLANSLAVATGNSAANQNATRLGAGQLGQAGQLGALQTLLGGNQASAGLNQNAASLLGNFGQQGIGNQQSATGMLGGFAQQGLGNQQNAANLISQIGGMQNQGQLGAANTLGGLAGQAGGADFSRLLQAFGVGTGQAQQNDVETQRNLGILMNLLGTMQQGTLGVPQTTSPSGFQQGAGLGGQIGALLALAGQRPPDYSGGFGR